MLFTLPPYQGGYKVGFIDLETKSSEQGNGVLMRVYYPSTINNNSWFQTSPWLPDSWAYSQGYGNFLKLASWQAALAFPLLAMTRKQCLGGTDLIQPQNEGQSSNQRMPVAIFSHGLGGNRTTYSQLCANLASKGFIVAAIEHGDGSASFSRRSDVDIPYIHPNQSDDLDNLLQFRVDQVLHRDTEVANAIAVLQEIDQGKRDSLLSTADEKVVDQFKSRLDFSNLVMVGHSFGGATTIKVMQNRAHLGFKAAVLLDPWMFAVQQDRIKKIPTLNIQSNRFHWTKNLDHLKDLTNDPEYHKDSVFGHVKDTRHQDASDLSLFFPYALAKMNQSGPLDPQVLHQVQEKLIFDFLAKHVDVKDLAESKDAKYSINIHDHAVFGEQSWKDLYSIAQEAKK